MYRAVVAGLAVMAGLVVDPAWDVRIDGNRLWVRSTGTLTNANGTQGEGERCHIPMGEVNTKLFRTATPGLYKYIARGTPPGHRCMGGTAFWMSDKHVREVAAYMPIVD